MANNQEKEAGNKEAVADKGQIHPPAITLPKGGGGIRGIGEKFAANPVTGTGSMTVPIATSPGRSGFGPQLSLSYDSGSGNGPFGFGWSLSLPSISRKTDKGLPQYRDAEESDEFILSGAEDLVPILVKKNGNWEREKIPPRTVDGKKYDIQRFRPRIEGLFARIERWTNQAAPTDTFWRSISKDNIATWYGKTANSRIFDPAEPSHIFSWLICQSYDDKGNAIVYEYAEENSQRIFEDQYGQSIALAHERNRDDKSRSANRYLKRIVYGNLKPNRDDKWQATDPSTMKNADGLFHEDWMFEVVFDYGEGHYSEQKAQDPSQHDYASAQIEPPANSAWPVRHDPFSSYRAGFEVRTYRLCRRVLMFHHFPDELDHVDDYLVRSTEFAYESSPIASFITSVKQSGYKYYKDKGKFLKKSLPPLEFVYSKAIISEDIQEIDPRSLENLPNGLDGSRYQWVDLDGEGLSGILTEQAGAWFYKANLGGGQFGPLELVTAKPSLAALSSGQQQLLDLAGDGQLDLVEFGGPVPGFYERTEDQNWEQFRSFISLPNIPWNDPNLRFVDLTGDGHADVLITENEVFTWYPSLVEEGFGQVESVRQALEEEKGPRLVFADGTQSIYLADLSGDGLSDLARIRNGEICYWPNLGYGRFGAKVTMDNAPWFDAPDLFDQKRIRLADIDGSGTTDIIYLNHDRVAIYRNECGNSWSKPEPLNNFPPIDNLSSVMALDLLGTGTACLVWSSPLPGNMQAPMKYINLMKEGKPHLLTNTVNNLGAETIVRYAPSTKFYLKDREDGKPWITRLPFPVHVVERIEMYDYISRNRFVTRYAYHHGYFDGEEREFRGFGMVEQQDTEEFAVLSSSDTFPDASNIDQASHVPPVVTKTWFHTGAYIEGEKISRHFEDEYYREPGLSPEGAEKLLLDDTVLPDELSPEEEREACRGLKGSMLRQEVYALDATGTTDYPYGHPYTVTEQNFAIRCLQPRGGNNHGVFFTHPHEAINYHYERNPADPRITHAMTLEVDNYGNVRKSLSIGYGRRQGLSPLQGDDKKRQEQTLITYTENDVTNQIDDPAAYPDDYRTPLPCEACTYEVTGFALAANAVRFKFKEFADNNFQAILTLPEIEYEQPTDYTKKQKRLIECVRTLYRKNDLSGPMLFGEIDPLGLSYESYKLAFTADLAKQIFITSNTNPEKPTEAALADALSKKGGYIHWPGDANSQPDDHWWIPSGKTYLAPVSVPQPSPVTDDSGYASSHFYLPHAFQDPWGNLKRVRYDDFNLLVVETRDATDNVVTVETTDDHGNKSNRVDYRTLQPYWITDPNGNRSRVAFDALGMVVATAVMGKAQESDGKQKGDVLDDQFVTDLIQKAIDDLFEKPLEQSGGLLGSATTRIVYDLNCFKTSGQPVFAATLARETHFNDPLPPDGLKIQVSFSYSDGFGRKIQKKIQAEPGKVEVEDDAGNVTIKDSTPNIRWVGTGWTIFNNKGKPVRQYEPFFSIDHRFQFGKKVGVSPILFYDPIERIIATLHPNNTYEKVVFDPWQQKTYDVNDTVAANEIETGDPRTDADIKGYVLEYFKTQPVTWQTWYQERITGAKGTEEKSAAEKAAKHTNTSTTAHFDTLGRPFLTLAHNRFERNGTVVDEKYATRVVLDIEGNQRAVLDERKKQDNTLEQRIVIRYDYDMLSNSIHQASMEAGERWMLNDAAGKPICAWDSRGFTRQMNYDALRRPTELFVTDRSGKKWLAERTVYGEGMGDAGNHRTRVWQVFDGAGIVTNEGYDFKGNLLHSTRKLVSDYTNQPDWGVSPQPSRETETFISRTWYDALNRPIQIIAPHSDRAGSTVPVTVNVIRPGYNEANLLERIDVWLERDSEPNILFDPATTPPTQKFVQNINYNAKGQRELIEYGNGARTRYEYDPLTFRLSHLFTTWGAGFPQACADELTNAQRQQLDCPKPQPQCKGLQNLYYTYDPAGNITHIQDNAQQTIYFRNRCVEPSADYIYDAIYRLINATGREHSGQSTNNKPEHRPEWKPQYDFNDSTRTGLVHPNDGNAMRTYIEEYTYDEVGNFIKFHHGADGGTWTRYYDYSEDSLLEPEIKKNNRLSTTSLPGDDPNPPYSGQYSYDMHGNMIAMPHLKTMSWDFKDQLQQVDLGGGGIAYYVYDSSGRRVRKVWEKSAGLIEERIYLGGFEVFRKKNGGGAVSLERETLHIMDDKQRIALIETRTQGNEQGVPQQLIRYQLSNHLGSASLELDDEAKIISYEEFFPYGSTSFQSVDSQREVSAKRYRYTGKERDEETGLYYHGARYYAAWLGRWVSCDSIDNRAGLASYVYVSNNPIILYDPNGKENARTDAFWSGFRGAIVQSVEAHLQGNLINVALGPLVMPLSTVQTGVAIYQKYKEEGVTGVISVINPLAAVAEAGFKANQAAGIGLALERQGYPEAAKEFYQESGREAFNVVTSSIALGSTVAGGVGLARSLGVPGTYQSAAPSTATATPRPEAPTKPSSASKGPATVEVRESSVSIETQAAKQIRINSAAGSAHEVSLAEGYKKAGFEVVTSRSETGIKTSKGMRYPDIDIYYKGQLVEHIEAKASFTAKYSKMQQVKDAEILKNQKRITSVVRPDAIHGVH